MDDAGNFKAFVPLHNDCRLKVRELDSKKAKSVELLGHCRVCKHRSLLGCSELGLDATRSPETLSLICKPMELGFKTALRSRPNRS